MYTNGEGRMNDSQSRGTVVWELTCEVVPARDLTQARATRSEDVAGQRGARGLSGD